MEQNVSIGAAMSFDEMLTEKIISIVDKRVKSIYVESKVPTIDENGEIYGMANINRYLKEKHNIDYSIRTLYKKKSLGEIPIHSADNKPFAIIKELDEFAKAGCPNWKMYKARQALR